MRRKALLRSLAFALGGALAGLAYYRFFGCRTGCPITASPVNTMVWMAVVGLLLSNVFSPKASA